MGTQKIVKFNAQDLDYIEKLGGRIQPFLQCLDVKKLDDIMEEYFYDTDEGPDPIQSIEFIGNASWDDFANGNAKDKIFNIEIASKLLAIHIMGYEFILMKLKELKKNDRRNKTFGLKQRQDLKLHISDELSKVNEPIRSVFTLASKNLLAENAAQIYTSDFIGGLYFTLSASIEIRIKNDKGHVIIKEHSQNEILAIICHILKNIAKVKLPKENRKVKLSVKSLLGRVKVRTRNSKNSQRSTSNLTKQVEKILTLAKMENAIELIESLRVSMTPKSPQEIIDDEDTEVDRILNSIPEAERGALTQFVNGCDNHRPKSRYSMDRMSRMQFILREKGWKIVVSNDHLPKRGRPPKKRTPPIKKKK